MLPKTLIIIGLYFMLLAGPTFACPDDDKQAQVSDSRSVFLADAKGAWDEVEDGAEDVGSSIERQWEKVEDGVTGEGPEERAEEAEERREDRLEEIEEERD